MDNREITDLNELLFSTDITSYEIERWQKQAFNFCKEPGLGFTLLQNYGGPCGVIASVQAFLCKNLILAKRPSNLTEISALSRSEIVDLFVASLSEITTQSSPSKNNFKAVFAKASLSGENCWEIHRLKTEKELYECIQKHAEMLMKPFGVLGFVYSVLLTRGAAKVISDMDNSTEKLIKRHGHCSQELVNLLLTGKAVSNLFDGVKTFPGDASEDALRLCGIEERPAVGFLTTLEALGYVRSGENFKTPVHPVWLAASSSHYTTLFALDPSLVRMSDTDLERKLIRRKFEVIDQFESGLIGFNSLEALIKELDLAMPLEKRLYDRVLMAKDSDALTFEVFFECYRAAMASFWVCHSCTVYNEVDAERCATCDSGKPPAEEERDEVPRPEKAVMYHYDAEAGTRASGRLKEFEIEFESDCAPSAEKGESFYGLLRTKWPRCLVRVSAINGEAVAGGK